MEAVEAGTETAARRPTGVEWLALFCGLFLTLAYGWILDDGFVYFRYVDNLLFLGRGLVFNEGEFVEGFSSPLWCLLLIPLRVTELDWWLLVRLIGLASYAASWWLLVDLNRRLSPGATPRVNVPLLAVTFTYGAMTHFTSGVEAPFVQVVAVCYALFLVDPTSRPGRVGVALSPLVRHELALPFLVACAFAWRRDRRVPWGTVLGAAATTGAYVLFRVWYYADLFPNTFYLKDEVNWGQGMLYVKDTLLPYRLYALAPAALVLALGVRKRPGFEGAARAVMLVCAALVTAYVVKIGGDGRHYRYLAFPFVLAACSTAGLAERALARFAPGARAAAAGAAGIALALLFASAYPRQLSVHPLLGTPEHTRFDLVNDAEYHRQKDDLGFSPWVWRSECELLTERETEALYSTRSAPPPAPRVWILDEYERHRALPEGERKNWTRTDSWCVRMFKRFDERLVHLDGLTDSILAGCVVASWRPGHKKGLRPLARDLARIQTERGYGPGVYRAAVEAGEAPEWIARHLETIEVHERKIYNRHALLENLVLAFTFPARIDGPFPEPGP